MEVVVVAAAVVVKASAAAAATQQQAVVAVAVVVVVIGSRAVGIVGGNRSRGRCSGYWSTVQREALVTIKSQLSHIREAPFGGC